MNRLVFFRNFDKLKHMIPRKLTIWLVGLMWFVSVSSFSTVVCHRSDGQIAFEPAGHNSCDCSGSEDDGDGTVSVAVSIDHDHCTDIAATSTILSPNRKSESGSIAALAVVVHSVPDCSEPSLSFSPLCGFGLSPFFEPLRTIVLLS